ncbi:DUF1036 domain-containing protein [Pyxidicoccus fallax]|uniref:DUF1036 domain-containing protein n=2 Tax=Pyxidicoccus fallax TaxID=394095 RepID=A0A848LU18_9BACT|nr:DUF1036 domain-containing protein [Pyxidicoccus fallax]NMO21169.1 DUF1036 domain-containing protein [Pyxidicoccus fallax]NPC82173.1 DUF1036 domain-containing protein [Pyxidicoccus fallax]
MNRRWFLRTGTLLGLGTSSIFTARAAELGVAANGNLFGESPSREAVLSSNPRGALFEGQGVNESPGLVRALRASDPSQLSPGPVVGTEADLATYQLHFRNSYGPRIRICISFYDPANCAAWGVWGTRGWWSIDHNQSVYLLNTTHSVAYYFAEADNGAFWAGDSQFIHAPQTSPFNSCLWNQRIGDRYLGMRQVNMSAGTYTVNLIA